MVVQVVALGLRIEHVGFDISAAAVWEVDLGTH